VEPRCGDQAQNPRADWVFRPPSLKIVRKAYKAREPCDRGTGHIYALARSKAELLSCRVAFVMLTRLRVRHQHERWLSMITLREKLNVWTDMEKLLLDMVGNKSRLGCWFERLSISAVRTRIHTHIA
jgi:hypothetical protein